MNDGGLDFTKIPAPGTLEIASAYVDDAAASGGEREYAVSFCTLKIVRRPETTPSEGSVQDRFPAHLAVLSTANAARR